jgi:hypothetical protein
VDHVDQLDDHNTQLDDHHNQLSKLRSLGEEKSEEMHGISSDLDKFSLTQSSKQVPKVKLNIFNFSITISGI